MDAFEQYVRAGLERLGVGVDDTDIAIMRVIEAVYGPERDALLAADLAGFAPEHDLDPGRAPST